MDTSLYYRNIWHLEPHIHTFGKGWDKPPLCPCDYWISDPLQALPFKEAQNAIDFMNKGLKRVGTLGQFTDWIAFSGGEIGRAKQTIVVEWEPVQAADGSKPNQGWNIGPFDLF